MESVRPLTFFRSPPSGGAPEAAERRHSAPRGSSRAPPPPPGPLPTRAARATRASRGFTRTVNGVRNFADSPSPETALASSQPLPGGGAAAPGRRSAPESRQNPTRAPSRAGVPVPPPGLTPPAPEVRACALASRERASGAEGRRGRGRGCSQGVPAPAPRRSAVAVTTGAAATAAGERVRRRLPAVPPKQAAAARPCCSPRLPARGEGTARPPPARPPAGE